MNRASLRLFLLAAPTVLVATWGFLSRAADLPFSLVLATVFAAAPARRIYLQAKHLLKLALQRLLRRG